MSDYAFHDRRRWSPEHDGNGGAEPAAREPTSVEKLEARLAEKDQQLRSYAVEHHHALEGLERAKGRIEREGAREVERAKRAILIEILPVADDLERALEAAHSAPERPDWVAGVELVLRGFLTRLERLGVTRLDPAGERFEPSRHEAVTAIPVNHPDHDGVVVAVLRPGYAIGSEILRPAEVAVGKLAS